MLAMCSGMMVEAAFLESTALRTHSLKPTALTPTAFEKVLPKVWLVSSFPRGREGHWLIPRVRRCCSLLAGPAGLPLWVSHTCPV